MREKKTIRKLQNKNNGNEWITFRGIPTMQTAGMINREFLATTPNATVVITTTFHWPESPGNAFQYGTRLNGSRNTQYHE